MNGQEGYRAIVARRLEQDRQGIFLWAARRRVRPMSNSFFTPRGLVLPFGLIDAQPPLQLQVQTFASAYASKDPYSYLCCMYYFEYYSM